MIHVSPERLPVLGFRANLAVHVVRIRRAKVDDHVRGTKVAKCPGLVTLLSVAAVEECHGAHKFQRYLHWKALQSQLSPGPAPDDFQGSIMLLS